MTSGMRMKKLHKSQAGLVSFVVVTIIMLVLSLIVVAFAKLVRREQRQTLDRQLNSQAFYAAESGVNDAREALSQPGLDLTIDYTSDCQQFITAANPDLNPVVDGVISYSCLLVDPSPTTLEFGGVAPGQSIAVPLRSKSGVAINTVTISWEDPSIPAGTETFTCGAPGTYPADWPNACQAALMRAELVRFDGGRTRDQLITDRSIAFLYPGDTSQNFGFGAASGLGIGGAADDGQGLVREARCAQGTTPRDCTITISGLNAANAYLRLRTIYRQSDITVSAIDINGNDVELMGAQAEIDATGKANDILKRIKVRAPYAGGIVPFPEFALQSTNTQCKRFEIIPPNTLSLPAPTEAVCNPAQPH